MASRDINEPQHAFRFLDVDEEPQGILPPIQDYENAPLTSLSEAVIPLEPIVPDIKCMVQTVKANCGEPEDGLTRDESNSIRLYTLEWQPKDKSLFYILNQTLRSAERQLLKPWLPFIRLILTALSHLPSASLIVYRGINMDLTTKYLKDETVIWWGSSSCMKKSNQLEKRLFLNKTSKRTLFVINCYSGKNIHHHSLYEGEVLLPPARRFNVVSSTRKEKGLYIIELNEIQPAFDFCDGFSSSIHISTNHPTHNIQFQPISTVSLSKKSLPAALSNLQLEERLSYAFKRPKNIDLKSIELTDSDMDIIVSEIIIHRQCLELNLSSNNFTDSSMLILAHVLRKNTVISISLIVLNVKTDAGEYVLREIVNII